MTILKTHSGTVTVTTSKHQVRKKQQQNLQANFDHAQTNNALHIASALGSFFQGVCCTAYFQAWFRISELAKVPETMVSRRSSSFRSIRCKKNSRAPGS